MRSLRGEATGRGYRRQSIGGVYRRSLQKESTGGAYRRQSIGVNRKESVGESQ